jgi:hypothetical protein
MPEISSDEYDADDESDDSSDFGCSEVKPPANQKQTEFTFKQLANRMWQAAYSAFNKWTKGWVAGFLEQKHRFMIWGYNRLKQLSNGPLHREIAVADLWRYSRPGCR